MQINYKEKYKELKLKVKDLADLSFRLGVEEGLRQGQIQQQQQQQQMDMQQQQMAAQGGQPGQPGQPGQEDPGMDQNDPNAQQASNGSELDQHISQLESMIQKTDQSKPEYQALKKSLDSVKAFQSDLRQKYEMKKADAAIKSIGQSLKKPFAINKRADANLNHHAKAALNSQEKMVADIMKGWADEEQHVLAQVNKTLSIEGILNKE